MAVGGVEGKGCERRYLIKTGSARTPEEDPWSWSAMVALGVRVCVGATTVRRESVGVDRREKEGGRW